MPAAFKKLFLFLVFLFGIGALILTLSLGMTMFLSARGVAVRVSTSALVAVAVVCLGWIALALTCARALIGVYREELRECAGRWHLSLSELLLASLVTAMLMLAAQTFCTRAALPYGIGAAILLGLYFTGDLLISARKGNNAAALKTVASIGTVLKAVGWTALAVALFKTFDSDFVNRMFFVYGKNPPESGEASLLNLLRFGLLCLPTGFLLAAFSAQFVAVPTTADAAPEETLRKLLDVKSGLHRAVDKGEK